MKRDKPDQITRVVQMHIEQWPKMMQHLNWGLHWVQNGIVVVIKVSSLNDGIQKEDMLAGRITVSIDGISVKDLYDSGTEIKRHVDC